MASLAGAVGGAKSPPSRAIRADGRDADLLFTDARRHGRAGAGPLGLPLLRKPYRIEDLATARQRVLAA